MAKKKLHNKIYLVPLFLIVAVISYFVFTYLKNQNNQSAPIENEPIITQNNLQISLKECDDTIDPWNEENLGVKESEWLDESTLLIKTHISLLCGGESLSKASYEINNNELEVVYATKRADQITKCICAKELDYSVSDLPKKEYSVSIRRE